MLFDERQVLLKGESVCEEVRKCQHEETKKWTFLLKALLCLASGTWVFTEAGCLDIDVYMRLWLGSHLGWNLMISNFLDDTNRMLKVGSVYPSRERVKWHAYARACSLQKGNWDCAWQISSFPQPFLLPGIHRVPWHGQAGPTTLLLIHQTQSDSV